MAIAPSCGWVVDANAVPILDSQGFCCSCSFDQLLGTSSNSLRSSQLQCDLFGNAQSAHCLRMGELWYAIYELSAPQLDFEIIVTATQANGSLADYTLSMGPDRPGVSSSVMSMWSQDCSATLRHTQVTCQTLAPPSI